MCRTFFTNHTLCGHLFVHNYACSAYLKREEKKQHRSFFSKLFQPPIPPTNCKQPDVQQTQFTYCRECAKFIHEDRLARQINDVQQRMIRQLNGTQEPTQRSSSTQPGVDSQSGRNRSPSRDENIRRDARAATQRYKDIPRGVIEDFIALPGSDLNFFIDHSSSPDSDERTFPQARAHGRPSNPRSSTTQSQSQSKHLVSGDPSCSKPSATTGNMKDVASHLLVQRSGAPTTDCRTYHLAQELPPQPGPAPTRPLPKLPGSAGLSRSHATATRGKGSRHQPPSSPGHSSTVPVTAQDNSQLWQASAVVGTSRKHSQAGPQRELWRSQRDVEEKEVIPAGSEVGARSKLQSRQKGDNTQRISFELTDNQVPRIPQMSYEPTEQRAPQLSHVSYNLERQIDAVEAYYLMPKEEMEGTDVGVAQKKYWDSFF